MNQRRLNEEISTVTINGAEYVRWTDVLEYRLRAEVTEVEELRRQLADCKHRADSWKSSHIKVSERLEITRKALEVIAARKPVALEDGREWRMEVQDCARIAKEALEK